jgi:hypothetical protein
MLVQAMPGWEIRNLDVVLCSEGGAYMIARPAWAGWIIVVVTGGCTALVGLDDEFVLLQDEESSGGGSGTTNATSSTGGAGTGGAGTGGAGTGGAGTGGAGTGGAGTGGAGTGGAGTGGAGGTGGMAMCFEGRCGEYITDNPPEEFCPDNPSKALYDDLFGCVCDLDMNPATPSPCNDVCKDTSCAGKNASAECVNCIQDTMAGCGNQFNTCANDF